MFRNVSDEDWESLNELNEGYPGIELLIRIQNEIIRWYEDDLINQLRLSARAGKSVNTDIISGILEGANAISIRNLLQKADQRQKDRGRKDGSHKEGVSVSASRKAVVGVRDLRI